MSFAKIAAMALCASAVTASSWAEKPDWAGGQGHKREQMRDPMHEPAGYGAHQDRERKLRQEDGEPGNRAQPPAASGARVSEGHRARVRG